MTKVNILFMKILKHFLLFFFDKIMNIIANLYLIVVSFISLGIT